MDKLDLLKNLSAEFKRSDEIAKQVSLPISTLASLISQLEGEELIEVKREKKLIAQLTQEGAEAAVSELPERKLISQLSSEEEIGSLLQRLKLEPVALQWAKKNNWVMLLNAGGKTLVKKIASSESEQEKLLEKLKRDSEIKSGEEKVAKELRDRRLVKLLEQTLLFVKVSKKGVVALKAETQDKLELVNQVTAQMVKQGFSGSFREYDVGAEVNPVYAGKRHPLQLLADEMREVLVGMGFEEMNGPLVESSFWNFDVMFMPQNHPNRDLMDTFFLKKPNRANVPEKLASIVKEVQLNGWKTGSKGCANAWSVEEAQKTILRTHTTATTFRYLEKIGKKEIKTPCKFFSINKVFRNEAIDRTHLPEFHQIEGFVVADNLNLRSLMGVFTDFYKQLGISKIRFKPVFNPYTEPSMEIFGYHNSLSKWVEIGNSGIFRPETTAPLGIKQNVIAWGLALERAAMILFEVDDIRKVVGASTDLQWIRDFPELPEVLR
ncbi:MAG: phenylalanine--tRNA ligase subunit alpha [Candidatus Micrarchaeota archaeon]|nr:phenylalanine--tRNA ligase subunit alpha [Candidatus Micrarchaeota archaeon]